MSGLGQSGSARHNMTGGGVNPNRPFAFAGATRRPSGALQRQVQIEPAVRCPWVGLTLFAGSRHWLLSGSLTVRSAGSIAFYGEREKVAMRKLLLAVLFACAFAGASAIPSASAERIPFAQAERPEPRTDMAIIYVYRTTAPPLLFSVGTYVDNEKRADLAGHSFTWFYITPGEHQLKFRWPFLAASPTVEFTEAFEAGQTYAYHYRGSMEFMGTLTTTTSRVDQLDPGAALAAMEACCAYRPALGAADVAIPPVIAPSDGH